MKTLEFEKQDSVGILKIHRPEAMNALNSQVMAELEEFFENIDKQEIRCLILTGSGDKSFVAGADIKEMKDFGASQARELSEMGQKTFQRIESSSVPTIAAVNGFALGGGMELALACDMIIASEKAKFGLPEVSLGIIPGYGGTQRLSRIIGRAKARYMALTGDMLGARRAYEWGLVCDVTTPEELLPEALTVAKTIASRGPLAVSWAKRAVNEGADVPQRDGMKIEADYFAKVFETKDKNEGVQAFIEKRKPHFTGQ